jgi:tRNA A-37 threonylcarbamoyl transferase component Bud32
MPLSSGARLGPYEILSAIGAGGMGEVYKARDTRLDRIVAIKVSKEQFTERFEREVRAIASLNHPHICTLHDVGPNYLVMEYIEGTPLKGPLPLGDALRLASQIAGALDAAHRKGITHRDLKPGNILVTKAGVKLLDFGLAKVTPAPSAGIDTETQPLTDVGVILGTLQYMSPEQVEGREADQRSDIFSFGLVLYELLAGARAFSASTQAGLMAAILKEEPRSLTSLQPSTPPALDRTVSKCLAKDPDDRWQSARDLKGELEWIAAGNSVPDPVVLPQTVSRRSLFPWIVGAAAGAAGGAGLAAWAWRGQSSPAAKTIRRLLAPPEGTWPARVITRQSLALSLVGGRLGMIANTAQGSMVWVQRLDSLTANPLPGTEGADVVFWSPDGQFIGFWAGGKMKKIPAEGGTPLPICEVSQVRSATWNQDGMIVVGGPPRGDSFNISVNSGKVSPRKVVSWPKFLPGGKRLLYVNIDSKIGGYRAYVSDIPAGGETELMPTDTQVNFVPDQAGSTQGYLLFGRGATLLALRFDAERLRVSGDPVAVAKDVPFFKQTAWSEFDASADGVLIHSTGRQEAQLTWLDRGGRETGVLGDPQDFLGFFRLSPDGKKLAADLFDFNTGGTSIWTYDVSQGTHERVTSESGGQSSPVWSPDGARLAFGAAQAGPPQLKMKAVSDRGGGEGFSPGPFQQPHDWSSDGRWIFYGTTGGDTNGEIWVASVADRKVIPLRQTQFDSALPVLSPNREYLAFSANDAGHSEIYVQRFDASDSPKLAGNPQRISRSGGNGPRWRRDGKELFFLSPDRQIMAVSIEHGTETKFGHPAALFQLPTSYRSLTPVTVGYEVSGDGQRFLVPIRKAVGAPLQVVVNWQAGLKG